MTDRATIVKVGGSLFDWPDLGDRLHTWLKTLDIRRLVLLAGGGAAADVVRNLDRVYSLGEERSHWLALRALSMTAGLLRDLLAGRLVESVRALEQARRDDALTIFDLFAFASADEGQVGCLPHCWEVTSDSLAARVAEVLEARELILLKSVTIPPEMSWAEASRHGLVDAYFPKMIARGIRARSVNLREWRP